jgi:hypothetical protein
VRATRAGAVNHGHLLTAAPCPQSADPPFGLAPFISAHSLATTESKPQTSLHHTALSCLGSQLQPQPQPTSWIVSSRARKPSRFRLSRHAELVHGVGHKSRQGTETSGEAKHDVTPSLLSCSRSELVPFDLAMKRPRGGSPSLLPMTTPDGNSVASSLFFFLCVNLSWSWCCGGNYIELSFFLVRV